MTFGWLLFFYFFGGLTFLPLVALTVFVILYWVLPQTEVVEDESIEFIKEEGPETKDLVQEEPEKSGTLKSTKKRNLSNASAKSYESKKQPLLSIEKETDTGVDAYMTGWLTVSREYFTYPIGTNTAHKTVEPETQNQKSAYSNLFKILSNSTPNKKEPASEQFDDLAKPSPKKSKAVKYFVVLKHGNLFLYTNAQELDVKHAIVIANYVVTIWPPNLRDGELFSKRHAICLAKKPVGSDNSDLEMAELMSNPKTPPKNSYFLYSDTMYEKEDFYFTLIKASKKYKIQSPPTDISNGEKSSPFNPVYMAHPSHFKTSEMMDLIQTLHSTDANIQTRWLNAILGRLFLSAKGTTAFEDFFKNKIISKLSRSKKSSFLSDIQVTKIIPGTSIPFFTNPKLLELTPEGKLSVDVDMEYAGGFAIEIATKALINLGSRFKTREVPIVLLIKLQRLEGKLVFKMKPPPSARLWYTFESAPKMTLRVEPIVSSRQITYSVITNAIEKKIREAVNESLVAPFYEDFALFSTVKEFFRGGLWDSSVRFQNPAEFESEPVPSDVATEETVVETIIQPKVKERPVDPKTSRSSLRHRKSTPDLRSSQSNIELDETFSMPPLKPNMPRRGMHKHKSSDSLRTGFLDSSYADHNNEFIGEAGSKQSLTNSVKRWGSWYFKNSNEGTDFKRRTSNGSDIFKGGISSTQPKKQTTKNSKADQSSASSPVNKRRSVKSPSISSGSGKPVSAPAPHRFPPELLNAIYNDEDSHVPSQIHQMEGSKGMHEDVNSSANEPIDLIPSYQSGNKISKSHTLSSINSILTNDPLPPVPTSAKGDDGLASSPPEAFKFPSLDHIPAELSESHEDNNGSSFSVPFLAPPPPMRERTLAKRGSNDNLRKDQSRLSSASFGGDGDNDDSGITKPPPVPTAVPYNLEKNNLNDLDKFLIETSAKFETKFEPSQQMENKDRIKDGKRMAKASTISGSELKSPIQPIGKDKKTSTESNLQAPQSQQQPLQPIQKQPEQIHQPMEEQPIMSYRKMKPKKSQGFKFFGS